MKFYNDSILNQSRRYNYKNVCNIQTPPQIPEVKINQNHGVPIKMVK